MIVNLDADVSFDSDFFERLLAHFEAEPTLGIASGTEVRAGARRVARAVRPRTTVWGAISRLHWACFEAISPLEERLGWDDLDELTAVVRGWDARTLRDLPFRHHRRVGGPQP